MDLNRAGNDLSPLTVLKSLLYLSEFRHANYYFNSVKYVFAASPATTLGVILLFYVDCVSEVNLS